MNFILDEKEYGVAEFYQRYSKKLPQIVQVTQGYCGEIARDVFDKTQVLRLHTVSRQKRVLAKTTLQGQTKLLGIPLSYEQVKLCVVDGNGKQVGKERYLADILLRPIAKLPITVQFSRDNALPVGSRTLSTNFLPPLQLIKLYEEISFLGNFLNDQRFSPEVASLPLYLRQVCVSVVTGISGSTWLSWQTYLKLLDRNAENVDYTKDYGNPDISEYQSIEEGKSNQEEDEYEYLEPARYSTLGIIFSKPEVSATGARPQKACTPFSEHPTGKLASGKAHVATRANDKAGGNDDYIDMRTDAHDKYEKLWFEKNASSSALTDIASIFASRASAQTNNVEDGVASGTKLGSSSRSSRNANINPDKAHQHGDKVGGKKLPPPLPPRTHTDNKQSELRHDNERFAIPKGHVTPMVRQQMEICLSERRNAPTSSNELPTKRPLIHSSSVPMTKAMEAKYTGKDCTPNRGPSQTRLSHVPGPKIPARTDRPCVTTERAHPLIKTDVDQGFSNTSANKPQMAAKAVFGVNVPTSNNTTGKAKSDGSNTQTITIDDISKFRIEDVSESLKMLGLGKYIQAFEKEMVDGDILVELDKDSFINDFGMKTVEAVRLVKFINSAHIPK